MDLSAGWSATFAADAAYFETVPPADSFCAFKRLAGVHTRVLG